MRLGSAGGSAPPTAAAGRARAGGARGSRGRPVRTVSAQRRQGRGAVPAAWRPRGRPRPSAAPTCSCRLCPPPAGRSLSAPPRAPRPPHARDHLTRAWLRPSPADPGARPPGWARPRSQSVPPIGPPRLSVSWGRLRPHWVATEGETEQAFGRWQRVAEPSVFCLSRLVLRVAPVSGSEDQALGAASPPGRPWGAASVPSRLQAHTRVQEPCGLRWKNSWGLLCWP